MLRLVLAVDDRVRHVPLPDSAAVVGSAPECDIVLSARGVSRQHARVVRGDGGLRLIDLGSKNGLIVEGSRRKEWELLPGQHVRLGTAWLTLEEISSRDAELAISIDEETKHASRPETRPDTVDLPTAETPGPAAALRLVRELQAAAVDGVTSDRSYLEQARAVLRASSLFALARAGDEEAALAAVAGLPPEPELLDRAAELARRSAAGTEARGVGDGGWLLLAPAPLEPGAPQLAAWWKGGPEPAEWQRELMACLGSVVSGRPLTAMPAVRAAGTQTLRFPQGTVLGTSPAMRQLLAMIEKTMSSGMDILLTGETGTGKELFARMIHLSGSNPDGPYIPVNCPGIPEELQEAEFFGIERNVATGVDRRPGFFQLADGGTLFLDEIGDMPLPLQAKLLRALQEREFLPVGGSRPKRVALRVVASTNRDLRAAVGQSRFRADLYFRLRQLQYPLPPLRERQEDVPALALEFIRRAAAHGGRQVVGLSRKALEVLTTHTWPGNVRELQYTIENAVALTPNGAAIESRHLTHHMVAIGATAPHLSGSPLQGDPTTAQTPEPSATAPGRDAALPTLDLAELERRAVEQALRVARGNKSEAARLLNVSRAGLYKKMVRLGISL